MKKVICLFALIVFFVNAEAQYKIKKSLGDFSEIEISGASKVSLFQSDSNYIVTHGKDSIPKNLHANIKAGVLYITGTFRGEVHAKNITAIRTSDACSVITKDTLRTDKLSLNAADAGRLDILVNAKTLVVHATDAGSITLTGVTDLLAAKASDASHIRAFELKAATVKAVAADGSSEDVWAVSSIEASATDGSNIHIKGNPVQKNTTASDGGSVTMDDSGDETTPVYGRHSMGSTLDKDTIFGKNKDNNQMADAFIGFGFVTGGNKGPAIKYGNSREFIMGFGGGHKFCKWDGLGFDVYYKSTDFFLAQNSGKSFPDTINHNAQKVSLQNFGGLIYDRIIFESGYHGIIALDLGFYGDWTFNTREVFWDNNYDVKTINRNLSFFNHGNYGVNARFVFLRQLSVYFNYRLSNVFTSSSVPAQQNLTLPAYTMGITFGLDGVK
jgi:hypothetical protein